VTVAADEAVDALELVSDAARTDGAGSVNSLPAALAQLQYGRLPQHFHFVPPQKTDWAEPSGFSVGNSAG
jgi:hypothetical protein